MHAEFAHFMRVYLCFSTAAVSGQALVASIFLRSYCAWRLAGLALVLHLFLMSDVKQKRREQVQVLRRIAREAEVDRCPDNANRDLVKKMADDIFGSDALSDEHREQAEAAWEAYRSSFTGWLEADGEQEEGQVGGDERWKFSAAQLTYNSTTGEWCSKDTGVLRALFDRFVAFIVAVLAPFKPQGISATLETSTRGAIQHVHAHVYFHLELPYRSPNLDIFEFEGIRPHCEPNRARGPAYKGAVARGHYYVVVEKVGTVFNHTDYPPFESYGVEGWWIDNWLKQGKLDRPTYLQIAARIVVGFQRRLADVRAADRFEQDLAVDRHVLAEARLLKDQEYPVKEYPEVKTFIEQFSQNKHRRAILAIVGGSNLGKSMLGAAILRQIATLLGLPGFLEITVEGCDTLDFSDFNHSLHAGVLLDGVGDAYLLHANREVLQGRTKKCKGGQSATMVYSYPYTLARRAVVATFDLSAAHLDALNTDHWLSNAKNVICLRLESEAYVRPATPPMPVVPLPRLPTSQPPALPIAPGPPSHTEVPQLPPIDAARGSPSRPPAAKRAR